MQLICDPETGILVSWIPSEVVATMMSPVSSPMAMRSPLGWMAMASIRLTNWIRQRSDSSDQQHTWFIELAVKNWSRVGCAVNPSVPVSDASPADPSMASSKSDSSVGSPFRTWSKVVPTNNSGWFDSKNLAQQMCWIDPWDNETLNVLRQWLIG